MAQYDYSISSDTATGAVNGSQLWTQLQAMATANPGFPVLNNVMTELDDLAIIYAGVLSAPQQVLLTAAVAAHTPVGPAAPPPTIDNQIRTGDPTTGDDDSLGYEPSVRWLNVSSEEEYLCTNSSSGAAVWKSTTSGGGGAPSAHAASHESGGSDEISVASLTGILADLQPPEAHATDHQSGGSDEINVASLAGLLADAQTPTAHASTHLDAGTDPIPYFAGATGVADGLDGLVPMPTAGEEGEFLKGDGSWSALPPAVYGDYYDSGTTTVGTSATKLTLDVERQSDALFSLASDEITVQAGGAGDYLVTYAVTFGDGDSLNRVTETWLELNGAEVDATRGEVIHWDEHGITGDGTCGRTAILTLATSDVLNVQAQVTTGSAGYTTATGGVGLTLSSIGGNGAAGPQGPAGAGSTVNVEDSGTPLAGTPHSSLNFSGFTVADAGGGVADITAVPPVFGSDYQRAESLARSTTTSTTFQDKLTVVTPTLTGTYRIAWMAVVDQINIQDSVEARLYEGTAGAVIGATQRLEPKDPDNREYVGGIALEVYSSESREYVIQYRQQDGSTAGIQNAVFEMWRTS